MGKPSKKSDRSYSQEAVESAASALRDRFKAMLDQMPAGLEKNNADGVHDMRVAVRRLLTALRDLGPFFGDGCPKGLKREIRLVAATLGVVRDHDVAMIELEKLRAASSDRTIDEGLRGFIASRLERRSRAFDDLRDILTEKRFSEIERRLSRFLKQNGNRAASGGRSYEEIGSELVADRIRRLRKIAVAVYDPFDSASLHELRMETKRLRYAAQLFGADKNDMIAEEVGRMQASLGDMHDYDVWIRRLSKTLKRAYRSGETAGSDYAAAEWSLGEFARKRSRAYRDVVDRWRSWRTEGFLETGEGDGI